MKQKPELTEDEYQAREFYCLTCDERFKYHTGVALGFDYNRFCSVSCAFTYKGPPLNPDLKKELDLRYSLEEGR